MARKVFELGELKVTVDAPDELIDRMVYDVNVFSRDALTDERVIKMVGGLTAFAPIDPTHGSIKATTGDPERHNEAGELELTLFTGGAAKEPRRGDPYLAELLAEQEAGRD